MNATKHNTSGCFFYGRKSFKNFDAADRARLRNDAAYRGRRQHEATCVARKSRPNWK